MNKGEPLSIFPSIQVSNILYIVSHSAIIWLPTQSQLGPHLHGTAHHMCVPYFQPACTLTWVCKFSGALSGSMDSSSFIPFILFHPSILFYSLHHLSSIFLSLYLILLSCFPLPTPPSLLHSSCTSTLPTFMVAPDQLYLAHIVYLCLHQSSY